MPNCGSHTPSPISRTSPTQRPSPRSWGYPRQQALPFEHLDAAIVQPQRLAAGGTLVALRAALQCGVGINLSGGYHHAKREGGEGFCFFSDISIAIAIARSEHGLQRIAVVDLDAHQGNGVSSIVTGNESVGVFDIYNGEIYPGDEQARKGLRWNHPLRSGCTGADYLELLERELPRALDEFAPQLVLYNAGTDIVAEDPLGQLKVDEECVRRRDAFVLSQTRERGIPTVTTASGGYSDLSYQLLSALVVDQWLQTSNRT